MRIKAVALDYSLTLTVASAAVVPHLGMRPVDPPAVPALRFLRGRGLRLLVASNTRPNLSRRMALRAAGVEHEFAALVESHSLGVAKPDARFYDAVIRAARCLPGEVLFVGDNLRNDVIEPLRHGMRAVFVCARGLGAGEALPAGAHLINHVRELPGVVEQLS